MQHDSTTGVCVQVCHYSCSSVCLFVSQPSWEAVSNFFELDTFGKVRVSQDTLVCVCVCVSVGGGGAVTLATQLHILQRLPQRKNVFLQHAITTDYRLPSLHQKLSLEKGETLRACVCVCAFVCLCVSLHTNRQTDTETKKDEKWL